MVTHLLTRKLGEKFCIICEVLTKEGKISMTYSWICTCRPKQSSHNQCMLLYRHAVCIFTKTPRKGDQCHQIVNDASTHIMSAPCGFEKTVVIKITRLPVPPCYLTFLILSSYLIKQTTYNGYWNDRAIVHYHEEKMLNYNEIRS